jgi:hypothetical protein
VHTLKDLEKKFSDIELQSQDVLNSYLSEVASNVCGRIISKGGIYNFRPYEIERAGLKKGRQLKNLPSKIKNTHVYHFDKDAKVILVEIYGQSETIVNKEFYHYGAEHVERTHFTSNGRLRNILASLLDDEIVMKDLNWGMFGCSESSYIYSGSRLDKILVKQKEHTDSSFSDFEVRFNYGNDELVKIMNIFPNGYEEQIFP